MSNSNLRDFLEIKQQHMEPFELFVKRLISQAKKCQFSDPGQMVKNQIIEQCYLDKLKQRAAECNEMTLDELVAIGIRLGKRYTSKEVEKQCTRCGSQHDVYTRCPASLSYCVNCKRRGHFTTLCFQSSQQKRSEISGSNYADSKRMKKEGSSEVPMPQTGGNGESSKLSNGCSDKLSTNIGTNVTTKKAVTIQLVGRSNGKSQDDRREFDVEAIVSDKYLVNVISNDLLEELKDKKFLDYSSENVPMEIAGTQFLGVFTTMVKKIGDIPHCTQIFIIKTTENCVTITRRLAKQLRILTDNK